MLYHVKSLTSDFLRIHRLKKSGLWRRLLCVEVGLEWRQVLNCNHILKKPLMHGKLEFCMWVRASVPQVKTCFLFFLLILSFSSMMSVHRSSSLSLAYLFNQKIFKERKKVRASMEFSPPSDFGPYRMSWLIPFMLPEVLADPVFTKLSQHQLISVAFINGIKCH